MPVVQTNLSGNPVEAYQPAVARTLTDDTKFAGVAISGMVAVCLGSGGNFLLPAERGSGARLPAIGVNTTNATSGSAITYRSFGFVPAYASGMMASGGGLATTVAANKLYVGSGGLIVNQSGYSDGGSSGAPTLSGDLIQRIGFAVSGGMFVSMDMTLTSGLFSGQLSQW